MLSGHVLEIVQFRFAHMYFNPKDFEEACMGRRASPQSETSYLLSFTEIYHTKRLHYTITIIQNSEDADKHHYTSHIMNYYDVFVAE